MENQSTISGLPSHYSVMASNFFSLKTWRWLFCLALAAPAWGATPTALPNVELTGGLLYQIIASEFAYQRQEPALAYQTYMQMASTTKDPRLAQRAFQIADSVHAFKDAQKAGQLWAELAPNDADARLADLLASIRSGELTPSLQNTAKELLRSEKDAKKKQQIFQIIALQVDLGNATDQEALEFIRPLAEILNNKGQAALVLAKLYRLTGDMEKCRQFAKKAFSDMPDDTTALLEYADILLKSKPKEALLLIENFVKKHPDDMPAQLALAKTYARQGNTRGVQKQLALLEPYAERSGSLAYTLASITDAVGLTNDTKRFLLLFERLSKGDEQLSDRLPQTYLSLGLLDLRQKHFEAAISWFEKVPKDNHFYTQARLLQAQALLALNQPERALKILEATRGHNQEAQMEIEHKKAQILYESGKVSQAYQSMKKALEINPKNAALLYQSALLAVELKKMDEAEAYLEKGIKLYPERADFYNTLGYLWVEEGKNLDKAKTLLDKALALEPENPAILDSVGWLYFQLKQYPLAQNYLEKAAQKFKDKEILLHLVEVYQVQGFTDKAMQILRPMLKQAPDDPEINACMDRLHLRF